MAHQLPSSGKSAECKHLLTRITWGRGGSQLAWVFFEEIMGSLFGQVRTGPKQGIMRKIQLLRATKVCSKIPLKTLWHYPGRSWGTSRKGSGSGCPSPALPVEGRGPEHGSNAGSRNCQPALLLHRPGWSKQALCQVLDKNKRKKERNAGAVLQRRGQKVSWKEKPDPEQNRAAQNTGRKEKAKPETRRGGGRGGVCAELFLAR